MTPEDHRVDKPFARARATTELPGARGASERSGTRRPPQVDEETPAPSVERTLAAEVRAMRAANDQFKGEMLAAYSQMRLDLRNDVALPAARNVEALQHKLEETQFDLLKHVGKWKRVAVAALAIASALFGGNAVQVALGKDITEAAQVVAVEAAESKAAEIETAHRATRELADESSRRIDAIESKLDKVLVAVDALVAVSEMAPKPAPPKKGKAR